MTDIRYSADNARYLTELIGEDNARNFFARNPEAAPGEEKAYPSTQPKPEAVATGGEAAGALGVEALGQQLINIQEQAAKLRTKQFEDAQAELKSRRYGPSLSERMFQLSAAFVAPTRQRGFAGMLGNVAPVLAQQSKEGRVADEDMAEKMRALQTKYDTGQLEDETAVISTRIKLAQLAEARRKASAPKIEQNRMTGAPTVIPNMESIARPKNDAEYDALEVGDWYIGYRGPGAGQPMRKLPPEED